MLDKKTKKVLKVLNDICEEGTYKVIEYDSLIKKFLSEHKFNKFSLNQMLDFLKLGQYIDIRYADNNTYCLCVLPKGRMVIEDDKRLIKDKRRINKYFVSSILLSAIMSFVGAFLAVFLYFKVM